MKTDKLVEKARDAIKKKNYDYAIELYQQALGIEPNNTEARKELRATEFKKANETGETGGFGAYLKGFGPFVKLHMFKMSKKWDECIRECENFLIFDPANLGVLTILGNACVEAEYSDAAIVVFEEILEQDKQNITALKNLGYLANHVGDFRKATHYFERAKKIDPMDGEIQKALRDIAAKGAQSQIEEQTSKSDGFQGMLKDKSATKKMAKSSQRLRTREDYDEAIAELEEQIEEEPSVKLYRKIAELNVKIKEFKEAEKAFKAALELDGRDVYAQDGLGNVRVQMYDEKLSKYKKKLSKEKSKELKAKYKQVKKEKLEFCIQEWGRRCKSRPTDLGLKFEYGNYLLKGGQVDMAIAEFQKTLKDGRREAESHYKLGACFEKKKKYDLAIKEYDKALASYEEEGMESDKTKEVIYHLGLAYLGKGDADGARTQFEKIYEVDINYKDVAAQLEAL